jgi:peptidyl-prolyl cis-trans isomerase SurA
VRHVARKRFGQHFLADSAVIGAIVDAIDPRQVREQARNALREQKFDSAYEDWVKDLRARAYVEMREPPQ